jgi:hypothetical protein
LNGGLKMREGFFRKAYNNITVNNSLHPHCWYDQCQDEVTNNIFMGAYRPAGGMPKGKWGKEVDRNLFTTNDGDRTRFAANGCDEHSVVGDPQFIDPATGDYRVKETSPALKLGFKNFPMDQFGVQKPELKKIAKTPALPGTQAAPVAGPATQAVASTSRAKMRWLQAGVKALEGEEFSAFGVSHDAGGLQLFVVPVGSDAAKAGFQKDDLVMSVNGKVLKQPGDLARAMNEAGGKPLEVAFVRNQQPQKLQVEAYPYVVTETSADGNFKTIPLAEATQVLRFKAIKSEPATRNEPLATLQDGKLAANYGPVFGNDVREPLGMYLIDLGSVQEIAEINTWSYSEGARGPQHFLLLGSKSDDENDPLTFDNRDEFVPPTLIAEVNTKDIPAGKFNATSVRHSKGASLGSFRWLIWMTYPLNATGEHTAFQEIQVKAVKKD